MWKTKVVCDSKFLVLHPKSTEKELDLSGPQQALNEPFVPNLTPHYVFVALGLWWWAFCSAASSVEHGTQPSLTTDSNAHAMESSGWMLRIPDGKSKFGKQSPLSQTIYQWSHLTAFPACFCVERWYSCTNSLFLILCLSDLILIWL